jgi:hypothetical protein
VYRGCVLDLGAVGVGAKVDIFAGDTEYTFRRAKLDSAFGWLLLHPDGTIEQGNLVITEHERVGRLTLSRASAKVRSGNGLVFAGERYRPTEPGAAPTNITTMYTPHPDRHPLSYRVHK